MLRRDVEDDQSHPSERFHRWRNRNGKSSESSDDRAPCSLKLQLQISGDYMKSSYRASSRCRPHYYGELRPCSASGRTAVRPRRRMKNILEQAARMGRRKCVCSSFADRRPVRESGPYRKWEWGNTSARRRTFDALPTWTGCAGEVVLSSADRVSCHVSPHRGAGSLYWLGLKDNTARILMAGIVTAHRAPACAGQALWFRDCI